jgi:beta-glucosidase
VKRGRGITAETTITNAGPRAGEEVAQLYLAHGADPGGPRCNLCGIRRLTLKPGESKAVRFKITPEMMQRIDEAGRPVLTPAPFTITIAPCSPGPQGPTLGLSPGATASFNLE